MILPYFFDRVPAFMGRLYAAMSGWQPVGSPVEIVVDEAADQSLIGRRIRGRITRLVSSNTAHGGPEASVVRLEEPLDRPGSDEICVIGRFRGHGPYRLPITWSAVYIGSSAETTDSSNVFAGGLMRLVRTSPAR